MKRMTEECYCNVLGSLLDIKLQKPKVLIFMFCEESKNLLYKTNSEYDTSSSVFRNQRYTFQIS